MIIPHFTFEQTENQKTSPMSHSKLEERLGNLDMYKRDLEQLHAVPTMEQVRLPLPNKNSQYMYFKIQDQIHGNKNMGMSLSTFPLLSPRII